jgi:hypothetical protein
MVVNQNAFLKRLHEAFASVPRPENNNIATTSEAMYKQEYADVAKIFHDQTSETLTLEVVSKDYDALYLFTPEAFQYYLPAYIRLAVLYPLDSNLPDMLFYLLTPPEEADLLDYWNQRTHLMTNEQKTVIVEFLNWYAEVVLVEEDLPFYGEQLHSALDFWKSS